MQGPNADTPRTHSESFVVVNKSTRFRFFTLCRLVRITEEEERAIFAGDSVTLENGMRVELAELSS